MATFAIKALADAKSPVHSFVWDLPVQMPDGSWKPGAWHRQAGEIEYRKRGLHVCSSRQVPFWTKHLRRHRLTAWVVEVGGPMDRGPNGWAVRRARLVRPWQGERVTLKYEPEGV